MVQALPTPEVTRCFFDDAFEPHLAAMCLRWNGGGKRLWELPDGATLVGPPPERFGVSIRRVAADGYLVRLLWDGNYFVWQSARRGQLLTSALATVLAALGTDIWYLLEQPVVANVQSTSRAA
jgi:hypothetical protein